MIFGQVFLLSTGGRVVLEVRLSSSLSISCCSARFDVIFKVNVDYETMMLFCL